MDIATEKKGLVLEGGGMRGVFTSGVLDYFMDREIYFSYTIAVSAGACNGLSFASRQRGRARYSNIDLLAKYHYIGWKYFIAKRNIMDFDLLFDKFPAEILPYDYETYFGSKERFVMVTTNCLTGEAAYLEEKEDPRRVLAICRASCSLPLLCPVTYVDGIPMLDGGICDPIPFRRALHEGCEKLVIVLTRNKGYRKKVRKLHLPWFVYRRYPKIRACLQQRVRGYNEALDEIDRLEAVGKALVIRPQHPVGVDRMEKDTDKLIALYEEGYRCAAEAMRVVIP